MMAHWKCITEDCSDDKVYSYKGLCRSCTKYGDNGSVDEPCHRVRVNKDGSSFHIQEVPRMTKPITRRDKMAMDRQYANDRKHNTKMRKVRQMMRHEGIDMDTPLDQIPDDISDELREVIQIGESVPHDCCAEDTCSHRQEEE